MPLTVQSPFTPKGDQPQAIAGIVEGLSDGLRFQTLLGITGSGKSVHHDEPVTIRLGPNDSYRGPIGPLIDTALGRPDQGDEHVEMPPPDRWQVVAWDPKRGTTGWRDITAISRHRTPDELYRLTTACGRQVRVTGDHSVWVLRDGRLQLLPTSEVVAGDALPVPERIPAPTHPLRQLDLLRLLEGVTTLNVDVGEDALPDDEAEVASWLEEHYPPATAYGKRYAMRHGLRGRAVTPTAALALRERSPSDSSDATFVGRRYRVPTTVDVTTDLTSTWGHYLAEGHAANRFLLLSVRDLDVREHLTSALDRSGIAWFERGDGDVVVGTKLWRDLFASQMGSNAHEKRLPPLWTDMSDAHLAALLRAYFEGDGGVDGAAVTAVTASEALAGDLVEALLRFGIWARLRTVSKRRPDGSVGRYHKVVLSGAGNLERFADRIGFLSERKRQRLALLGRKANTNVDLVYGVGARLRLERTRQGLLQREVAERAGLSCAMVSAVEGGHRNPSRGTFRRLCDALDLDDPAFSGLAELHWSPIEEVTTEAAEAGTYVYDFSVDDCETFLTGRGGLFVHNTYTMAKIIEATQRPALILAPNKILTAQLATEFREFFPDAAVEFFISYYDYYQPEAYVPARDLFIEKDANINMELERLRHSTTRSLLTRRDTIVVASVSAIYGLGSPEEYQKLNLLLKVGATSPRDAILERLVAQQYERNDIELAPGRFRAKGDVVEIWAAYEEAPLRIELWGDEIDRLTVVDPVTGNTISELETTTVFPAKHYVTPFDKLEPALEQIEHDLEGQLRLFERSGKLVEQQRLRERTRYDLEMLRTLGYCSGIENYSRYLDGRSPGEPPHTLLDYFPDDLLVFMDESHVMVPQIRGMYNGDQARKRTLVDYGFRLPGALDNRPLKQDEFFERVAQVVFVSATPADAELERSDRVVEQVIRPTGLIDPAIVVKPSRGQIDDLVFAVRERAERDERVLVTTLTKKMSEDLTEYFAQQGLRVRYMHSDIDAVERQVIIRDLRLGHFDVLVGINLLREGLDLPEVSLVAILDADKTGFLRSERSLIQTIGRAARNVRGEVFLYADEISAAMAGAIRETERRREKQLAYNEEHGITPESIRKRVHEVIRGGEDDDAEAPTELAPWERELVHDDLRQELAELETAMWSASEELDFERAAAIRDRIREVEAKLEGKEVSVPSLPGQKGKASSLKA